MSKFGALYYIAAAAAITHEAPCLALDAEGREHLSMYKAALRRTPPSWPRSSSTSGYVNADARAVRRGADVALLEGTGDEPK